MEGITASGTSHADLFFPDKMGSLISAHTPYYSYN